VLEDGLMLPFGCATGVVVGGKAFYQGSFSAGKVYVALP
jgi:hypothetical protein